MSKALKKKIVDEYSVKLSKLEYFIAGDYTKIPSEMTADLRNTLAQKKAKMMIVKNSIAKIALDHAGKGKAGKVLEGPVAVFHGCEDVVELANTLVQWRKKAKMLEFTGAFVDGEVLEAKAIEPLSKLPGKKELRAKIVGCIAANLGNIVRVINAPRMGVVYAVKAKADKETGAAEA